jgi:hypothetical protein
LNSETSLETGKRATLPTPQLLETQHQNIITAYHSALISETVTDVDHNIM